jgi:hypothetical protein
VSEERRKQDQSKNANRIRHPLTVWVDKIEFEPEVDYGGVTRTAYDLELTEYDMQKLYDGLKERLEKKTVIATRIRIIGRLVS